MGHRSGQALFLISLMMLTPLSGCFGQQNGGGLDSVEDVVVIPALWTGGVFQGVTIEGSDRSFRLCSLPHPKSGNRIYSEFNGR